MLYLFSQLDEKELLQLARQYTSEAVANYVTSIGYPKYAELFEDNDYSGDVLVGCKDKDLKDLGIESALARLKIIILFRRQLQGLHSLAKNFPADRIVAFLDGLKPQEKEQYKQSFDENEIDGEMLLAMKENYDVMIELRVKPAHNRMIWTRFQTLLDSQGYSTI